jgi:hypothetical protein
VLQALSPEAAKSLLAERRLDVLVEKKRCVVSAMRQAVEHCASVLADQPPGSGILMLLDVILRCTRTRGCRAYRAHL